MIPDFSFFRARTSGTQEAIYDFDTGCRYSYQDLEQRAIRLAYFLMEKENLKKGDRIAFCARNSVPFFDALFAAGKTGLIITTYNCLLNEKDLHQMVVSEDPRIIFYGEEYLPIIEKFRSLPGRRSLICLEKSKSREEYSYEDIMAVSVPDALTWERPDMEDTAMLIHTGGTTGVPKAAMIPWRSLFYGAFSELASAPVSNRDCSLLCLPLFHIAAWNAFTVCMLLIGGRVILTKSFKPQKMLQIIREERPTLITAVETIYQAMAAHPDFNRTDFSCFELLLAGAAPSSLDTLEKYWARGIKVFNAYGMTELGANNMVAVTRYMTLEKMREKWTSCGKAMVFNEVRLVDREGRDVEEGKQGELLVKSPLTFSGYWKNPEETAKVLQDGWVHTGDIARRDEEGFYYICGRTKQMFISGGENIFSQEIENIILQFPGIQECCVIGVPDPHWGEVGRALIVPSSDIPADKAALHRYLKQNLSTIKVPRYLTFVEEIPKNSVGKRSMDAILARYGTAEE